jgi:hypothetical protein
MFYPQKRVPWADLGPPCPAYAKLYMGMVFAHVSAFAIDLVTCH